MMRELDAPRMENERTIEIQGQIEGGNSVSFDRVKLFAHSPFALVIYSINGEQQEHGLRLDLDKRVFLDNLDNPHTREIIEQSAERPADFVQERSLSE
jgi:hypothetical protein